MIMEGCHGAELSPPVVVVQEPDSFELVLPKVLGDVCGHLRRAPLLIFLGLGGI